MKKTLLILFISLISFHSYAQNPDLFRTWYLHFFQGSDLGYPYEISDISPSINPYLEIYEDLNFNGEGACNTYEGAFDHLGTSNLETSFFNNTNDDCGVQIHNNFENAFFGFLSAGFWYEITQDSEGFILTFSTPIFGYALFKDYSLSTTDNRFNKLKIYPNPTSEKLFISSENTIISDFSIYTISGKKLITQKYIQNKPIDVSELSKGIYFIEISSSERKTVKKFIKE